MQCKYNKSCPLYRSNSFTCHKKWLASFYCGETRNRTMIPNPFIEKAEKKDIKDNMFYQSMLVECNKCGFVGISEEQEKHICKKKPKNNKKV